MKRMSLRFAPDQDLADLVNRTETLTPAPSRAARPLAAASILLALGSLFALARLLGLVCLVCLACHGGVVTEEFLDRLSWRESRGNPHAVGRAGEATAFQLRQCAVDDTCRYFGWPHRRSSSLTPSEARAFARGFCLILETRVTRVGCGQPSEADIFRAYRLGAAGFLRNLAAGPLLYPRPITPGASRGANLPGHPGEQSAGIAIRQTANRKGSTQQ